MAKSSVTEKKEDNHGYWMYSDGISRWGIGLMRNEESPLKTTIEIHNSPNIDTKIEWYKNEFAKIEEAKIQQANKK